MIGATLKFNPNHEPAGSSDGGQFASGDGGSGATPKTDPFPRNQGTLLTRERFDLKKIGDRRWMFNTKTGAFIMGPQFTPASEATNDHAGLLYSISLDNPDVGKYDDFIKGAVSSSHYRTGLIEIYTPPYWLIDHPETKAAHLKALEIFARNGAVRDTLLQINSIRVGTWGESSYQELLRGHPKSLGHTLLMQEVERRGLTALLLKELRARELWPQYLERLKFNPNHAPAGSPEGGEFTSGEGGGGEPMSSYSALYDYQNYAHGKINRDLREGHTSADHDAYVAAIDAAFSEAPARSATVWRGDGSGLSVVLFEAKPLPGDFKVNLGGIHSLEQAHAVNEQLTAHFRGMVVEDKAYLSTSSSQKIAMDKFVPGNYDISRFGGSGLVEISGKMKSLDIEKITKMGSKEKERLLPRGTKMRIDSVSVQPHPDGERVYLHWKASVVT